MSLPCENCGVPLQDRDAKVMSREHVHARNSECIANLRKCLFDTARQLNLWLCGVHRIVWRVWWTTREGRKYKWDYDTRKAALWNRDHFRNLGGSATLHRVAVRRKVKQ